MKRVVVTGLGIVSCIGNNQSDVIDSLKNLKSGITSAEEYEEFEHEQEPRFYEHYREGVLPSLAPSPEPHDFRKHVYKSALDEFSDYEQEPRPYEGIWTDHRKTSPYPGTDQDFKWLSFDAARFGNKLQSCL